VLFWRQIAVRFGTIPFLGLPSSRGIHMVIRLVLAFFFSVLAMPAANAAACYGPKEEALAKKLLHDHPELGLKLDQERNGVWFVRLKMCDSTTAPTPEDKEFLDPFFKEKGWAPLLRASRKHHLSRALVMIAMDDLHRAKTEEKGGLHVVIKRG
jgi:hypothetical protein